MLQVGQGSFKLVFKAFDKRCDDMKQFMTDSAVTIEFSFTDDRTYRAFPLNLPAQVGCILLAVHENDRFQGPIHPAVRLILGGDCPRYTELGRDIERWLSMESFCEQNKGNDVFHKSCKRQSRSQLYSVDTGLFGCQCDQACHDFNDCCLDETINWQPSKIDSINEEPWLSKDMIKALYCKSNEYFDERLRHGLGFYMIADCPYDYETELRRHCKATIDIEDQLVYHILPIQIGGILYSNIYCARCFGADLRRGQFWDLHIAHQSDPKKCSELTEIIRFNNPVHLNTLKSHCSDELRSFPQFPGFLHGPTRVGKLCLVPGSTHLEDMEDNFFANDCPGLAMATFTPKIGSPVAFLKVHGGFKAVSNIAEICHRCDALSLSLFTVFPKALRKYFTNYDGLSIDGRMLVFFDGDIIMNCETFKDCKSDSLIPPSAHVAISQAGCAISILVLAVLMYKLKSQKRRSSSKSQRVQFCFIASKIVFFCSFCLGYLSRNVACKVIAFLLHASLFLSFSYSMLLGSRISLMMWRLKKNFASMAQENKDNKCDFAEILAHVTIFILSILGGCAPLIYEHVSQITVFGYGENHICVVTNRKGVLYLVIIPTLVMLIINFINTLYSGFSLYCLIKSNNSIQSSTPSRLFSFLGRMISFQSLQWVLGLIYYMTKNEILGFVFEILVSLEGVMISSTFFLAELKSK